MKTQHTTTVIRHLRAVARRCGENDLISDAEDTALCAAISVLEAQQPHQVDRAVNLEVDIDLDKPGASIIADILGLADERNVAGAVAQHLVGAKLALRYSNKSIENYSYTTADRQLGRPGDFVVGDTAFHITVAPMEALMGKCAANIKDGYRVVLLVSESKLAAARHMAELAKLERRIGVYPIEQFVGQNVEEIGEFGKAALAANMRRLLEKYNERVAEKETDRSLLIRIPDNL